MREEEREKTAHVLTDECYDNPINFPIIYCASIARVFSCENIWQTKNMEKLLLVLLYYCSRAALLMIIENNEQVISFSFFRAGESIDTQMEIL